MKTITIGSRKSKLAMWQTEMVARVLERRGAKTRIVSMETIGDKILDRSIAKIGSKGVFTEELEQQLADGIVDIAVHSAKDMQSTLPEGFELIAYTERELSNDVLIGLEGDVDLSDQDRPLTIGTSSVRRVALLGHYYPHVRTVPMRGNLQTRIRKLKEGACDALMLAYAGVKRMGYGELIIHQFAENSFVPPVGQGCIAIEAATTLSEEKRTFVRDALNVRESELCLLAERSFLKTMEGGCSIPAFAKATLSGDVIRLDGGLASLDGSRLLQETLSGSVSDPQRLGRELGACILDKGGKQLLAEIRKAQQS